jgi:hypothetical protein
VPEFMRMSRGSLIRFGVPCEMIKAQTSAAQSLHRCLAQLSSFLKGK